jgi:hypothetical protein
LNEATGGKTGPLPSEAQAFLEQFEFLKIQAEPPRKLRDFYQGYDPTWYDILTERDAEFEVVGDVTKSLNAFRASNPKGQRLELLHGAWGTGKSTALLRIGREQIRQGQEICLFRGERTLDRAVSVTFYLPYWVFNPDATLEVTADYKNDLAECREDNNTRTFAAIG